MKAIYSRRSVSDRILSVQTATDNGSKRPELQLVLSKDDYTPAKLLVGYNLAEAAVTAIKLTAARRGDAKESTAEAKRTEKAARKACQKLAKKARVIFADNLAALTLMGLDKPMPVTRGDFLISAKKLFNTNAYTGPMKTALGLHTYSDEKLSLEGAKVAAFDAAVRLQSDLQGDAQDAADDERQAVKAMDVWMARFIKIARVAFEDNPQALERLKIIARTVPTKKQREGRHKAAATRAAKAAQKKAA